MADAAKLLLVVGRLHHIDRNGRSPHQPNVRYLIQSSA
jgi:hypothetical protein